MKKQEFRYRLIESSKALILFTESLVKNSLSTNIEYLIEPNSREVSSHLNKHELQKLNEINKLKNKHLNSIQTVDLLYDSKLVPLWINMEVYQSFKKKTIVRLLCSRRYRSDEDLNNLVDKFPPFHLGVPLPPWHTKGLKFNVNWKHQKIKRKWHALTWKWQYKKSIKNKKPN